MKIIRVICGLLSLQYFEIADVCKLLLLRVRDEREQQQSADDADCLFTFGRPHCRL
jgi:hypothetical protein